MKKIRIFSNRKRLKIDDINYLSKLLETKMSIKDCLNLLKTTKNQKIIDDIIVRLDKAEMIENIMSDYLPDDLKPFTISLLGSLSFNDALSISCDFYKSYNSNRNSILSSIAYPCILLFISISAMYLFDLYGIDTLFKMLKSFKVDFGLYDGIRIIFRIIINVIYYLFVIVTLLLIYYMQPKKIVMLYIILSKYFPDSLFSLYYCQEFVSLLLICIRKGYKSKQSLHLLKNTKHKPLISFLAYHLDDSLMSGETLNSAVKKNYYDSSLSRFIKIANYTNDFAGILDTYVEITKQRIARRLKRYTSTLHIFTYGFIGVIVIFVYQLLFIPMQVISSY